MNERTKQITTLAILSAIAYIAMLFGRFPFIPAVEFLKYDPKDVIIAIGGFIYGPLAAFIISLIVSIVEMLTASSTGFIGLFMNVLASAAFACTAALIYKKKKTANGALIGLGAGVLFMTCVMLLWSYIIMPIYFNMPRSDVVKLLAPGILPFNLIKGGVNAALTLLIYKPLVKALRASHLIPETEGGARGGKSTLAVTLIGGLLLITLVMLVLIIRGII